MMFGNIHPAAAKVLESYFREIDTALPGFVKGFYVYGSLSLGDFHPSKSDIDFVAVTSRQPSPIEVKKLIATHQKLRWRFLRTDMNGLYIDRQDMINPLQKNNQYVCFQNGRLLSGNLHENNLVTWHQIKTNALTLRGADPKIFRYTVTVSELRAEMKQNLNSYWVNWINRHRRTGLENLLLRLFPQKTEWGVLGVSRQWYTLETGQITSKTAAGQYCLQQFSDPYRDILETALAVRGNQVAPIRNAWKRVEGTFDYMEFIIRKFNQRYEELYANP